MVCILAFLIVCLLVGCGHGRDTESRGSESESLWEDIVPEYYKKQRSEGSSAESTYDVTGASGISNSTGALYSPDTSNSAGTLYSPDTSNSTGALYSSEMSNSTGTLDSAGMHDAQGRLDITESSDGHGFPYLPGSSENTASEAKSDFYITDITDDIWNRISGKSYKEGCPVPVSDLRYVHVLHTDAVGEDHEGELIVNCHIAEDVLEIFRQLYVQGYPIEKIRLVDEYNADDELSMSDNNTSCFNYRKRPTSSKVSKHGLGLAIDINPLYNPHVKTVGGKLIVDPSSGEPYGKRDASFQYKLEKGDFCYNLFIEHGFMWGGAWKSSKDYQHFEIPNRTVEEWYPNL